MSTRQPGWMVAIKGTSPSPEEAAMLHHPAVVGVTLFGRNIASVDQLRELNRELRAIRPDLIIAVDQEGGRVQRVQGGGVMRLPALMDLVAGQPASDERLWQRLTDHATVMACEVLELGFDLSFAPVVDRYHPDSAVIGNRAFSADPATITELSYLYARAMNACGMVATLKHYPGHGGVSGDTHTERPVDTRSLATLLAEDVQPYRDNLARLERAAVMCSHVIYAEADPSPAGFSHYWVTQVLRQSLGFQGVVMSDDLGMAAADTGDGLQKRAEQAVAAGCDLLLICESAPSLAVLADWPRQAADASIASALRARPTSVNAAAARQRLQQWLTTTTD